MCFDMRASAFARSPSSPYRLSAAQRARVSLRSWTVPMQPTPVTWTLASKHCDGGPLPYSHGYNPLWCRKEKGPSAPQYHIGTVPCTRLADHISASDQMLWAQAMA